MSTENPEIKNLELQKDDAYKMTEEAWAKNKNLKDNAKPKENGRGIKLDESEAMEFLRDGTTAVDALKEYAIALTAEVNDEIAKLEREIDEVRDDLAYRE